MTPALLMPGENDDFFCNQYILLMDEFLMESGMYYTSSWDSQNVLQLGIFGDDFRYQMSHCQINLCMNKF